MMENENDQNNQFMTEAYADFKDRLSFDYLIAQDLTEYEKIREKLQMINGNSSAEEIDIKSVTACVCCPLVIPYVKWKMNTVFSVEANHFAMVVHLNKMGQTTKLYGPGYHILGYYHQLEGVYNFVSAFNRGLIRSSAGDMIIAKVDQGTIMHFECGGQNIMLGPGIHQIREPMVFKQIVSLDSFYIEIGPEKWVTVPDGYDGIAVNRGKIKVLKGGKQHHLSHAGEVFAKMVPKTIQTDRIPTDIPTYVKNMENNRQMQRDDHGYDPSQDLQTSTCEGSAVILDAMIFWKITDTYLASQTVMEILTVEDGNNNNNHRNQDEAIKASSKNITTLRKNVLRIAKNYLTALVGSTTLAGGNDEGNMANRAREEVPEEMQKASEEQGKKDVEQIQGTFKHQKQKNNKEGEDDDMLNFQILSTLQNKSQTLKDIINKEFVKIGVLLENICIFKVTPSKDIQKELDKQTKARVDANTALINVLSKKEAGLVEYQIKSEMMIERSKAKAQVTHMNANARSNQWIINANGEAEAITILAKSRRDEAEKLESKDFAKQLAQIRAAGEAGQQIFQGNSNNFVFGQNPGDIIYGMFNKMGGNKSLAN